MDLIWQNPEIQVWLCGPKNGSAGFKPVSHSGAGPSAQYPNTPIPEYHAPSHRDRLIARRAMLRALLLDLTGREKLEFTYNEFKKPSIDGGPHFNASSSGDAVMIATATREVGVDIERIDPDFQFESLLVDHFTGQEAKSIIDAESFFRMWTRKEACAKAVGIGLAEPLSNYDVTNDRLTASGQFITVTNISAPEGYMAAVAIIGS